MEDERLQPPFLNLDEYEFLEYVPHLVMNLRMGFESKEQAEEYEDCIYALIAADLVENGYACLKAVNMVGRILWAENVDSRFLKDRVSRRDFLNFSIDGFLARIVSVNEILLYLLNHICETKLARRQCNIINIRRVGIPKRIDDAFTALQGAQEQLRNERNDRFHFGFERSLASDDYVYRVASDLEVGGMKPCIQEHGRKIDIDIIFREALIETQNLYRETLQKFSPILLEVFLALRENFDIKLQEKKSRQTKPLPWYPA